MCSGSEHHVLFKVDPWVPVTAMVSSSVAEIGNSPDFSQELFFFFFFKVLGSALSLEIIWFNFTLSVTSKLFLWCLLSTANSVPLLPPKWFYMLSVKLLQTSSVPLSARVVSIERPHLCTQSLRSWP